jgi:hypothetical protein
MKFRVTSTELLTAAASAYDHLGGSLREAVDPDMGTWQAYESGRRALAARARAQEWIVPEPVARRVEELQAALAAAPSDDALEWLERFPHTVLEAIDRRHRVEGLPSTPRRRFGEITREAAVARPR